MKPTNHLRWIERKEQKTDYSIYYGEDTNKDPDRGKRTYYVNVSYLQQFWACESQEESLSSETLACDFVENVIGAWRDIPTVKS